jgi:exosome complex component RRP45
MPREAEPSQNEKKFVLEALQQKLRLDGRKFDQYRPLQVEFEDEYGVAKVTLGKTMYGLALAPSVVSALTRVSVSSPKPLPR